MSYIDQTHISNAHIKRSYQTHFIKRFKKLMQTNSLNVLGTPLVPCSYDPLTGYYRDGCCTTDESDHGSHVVCAKLTQEFLEFSLRQGNDLITPRPEYRFKGLKPGDIWCLCALRWKEAFHAGVAPSVLLECTHSKALDFVTLEQLQSANSIAKLDAQKKA